MRKIKLKDKSLCSYGYAVIPDQLILPIKTKGIKKVSKVLNKMEKHFKIPLSNQRPANEEEVEQLKNAGYDVSKMPVMIKDFDKTSEKYKNMVAEENLLYKFLDIGIHVDLEYETDGVPVYKELELKGKDDYLGMANWLSELDMFESDYELLKMQIRNIKDKGAKSYEQYDKVDDEYEESE